MRQFPIPADEKKFMRRIALKDQAKQILPNGQLGRKLCLVCDAILPPRRSSYCSDLCWRMNTPSMIKSLLLHRMAAKQCPVCQATRFMPELDHILPVHLGGGIGCSIENYRIICSDCHKLKHQKKFNPNPKLIRFGNQDIQEELSPI